MGQDASFEILHAKIDLGPFGAIYGILGSLGANLGSLGENWIKRHSLQHFSRRDASFEALHAIIGLESFWGKIGDFGEFGAKWGVLGKIGSNDTHCSIPCAKTRRLRYYMQ